MLHGMLLSLVRILNAAASKIPHGQIAAHDNRPASQSLMSSVPAAIALHHASHPRSVVCIEHCTNIAPLSNSTRGRCLLGTYALQRSTP